QAQMQLCVATNHTKCAGEYNITTWGQGSYYGTQAVTNPATTVNSNSPNTNYSRFPNQEVIYRNTGIYVKAYKNRDSYGNPGLIEEYSFAYNPSTASNSVGPLRSTSYTYYYNTSPIPGNTQGLTYNILGPVASETLAGIGTITTRYNPTGTPSSKIVYGIEKDFTYN